MPPDASRDRRRPPLGRIALWLGPALLMLLTGSLSSGGPVLGSSPRPALASPIVQHGGAFTPGAVLLRLRPGGDSEVVNQIAAAYGYAVSDRIEVLRIYRLTVPEGSEQVALDRLQAHPEVEWAQLERIHQSLLVPSDSLYTNLQWNLRQIDLESAWEITQGDPRLIVAVLDTGVDPNHPDLAPNLVPGYDFINDDPEPLDDSSHGTHTAGIIAALGNNHQGIAGVAWNTRIMPIKVLDAQGLGPESALIKGLLYAVDQGARILNVSSGTTQPSAAMAEAVAYVQRKGGLIISAAGNSAEHGNAVVYPAAYPGVVAVGATDRTNQVASFSQRHDYVRVVAPGVDIPSTAWEGAGLGPYALATGTSAAAPHVAGVAALIWSVDPTLANEEVARLITEGAVDLGPPGPDPASGHGLVNAARALAALRPVPTPVPSAPPATVGPTPTPPSLPTLAPLPAPAPLPRAPSHWYFAEGSTKPPFHTWLHIFNPNEEAVAVSIAYLSPDSQAREQALSVPARARASVLVNQVLPAADFAIQVRADSTVFVERAMFFGHDGHVMAGISSPSNTWYFAEGATLDAADTWFLLQNPNSSPVNARLIFSTNDGFKREHMLQLPPNSRSTVYANLLLQVDGFATTVVADLPILAERAMYFDGGQAGHVAAGTKAPARTWYLAEGSTLPGFQTALALHNPGEQPAQARLRFMRQDGPPQEVTLTIAPHGRTRFPVESTLPNASFGTVIEATAPIVVERIMTFGESARGTHVGSGAFIPSQEWYFAEGSTKPPFSEYLAILNPGAATADVELSLFLAGDGNPLVYLFQVQPESRLTLDIGRLAPDSDVAARVRSSKPVVVERSMYFADGSGGTNAAGQSR